MVLGLMILSAIPTTIGVAQAVSEQKKQADEGNEEARMAKFSVSIRCDDPVLNGKILVMRDGKGWLDNDGKERQNENSFPAKCFYIKYPDEDRQPTLAVVSYISNDPPTLNWLYIDKDTHELKYGNRTESRPHHVGPWDWTNPYELSDNVKGGKTAKGPPGERIVLDQFEGFIAVEEQPGSGVWAVYFDKFDNGLQTIPKVQGKPMRRIDLLRNLLGEDSDRPK